MTAELSDKLIDAVRRERLSDELRELQFQNVAQLPTETYEDNLLRRARMRQREMEILKELAGC